MGICRTCEAMGVHEMWLVPPPAGIRYKDVAQSSKHASRGSEKFMSLRRFESAEEVAAECARQNRQLWVTYCPPSHAGQGAGAAPENPALTISPLQVGSVPEPLPLMALVLGTEGEGISDQMLRLADRAVYLPMYGFVQSLNVAVACGMLLQRLFDLCPQARGDITQAAKAELREQALAAVPRLRASQATTDAPAADNDHFSPF